MGAALGADGIFFSKKRVELLSHGWPLVGYLEPIPHTLSHHLTHTMMGVIIQYDRFILYIQIILTGQLTFI